MHYTSDARHEQHLATGLQQRGLRPMPCLMQADKAPCTRFQAVVKPVRGTAAHATAGCFRSGLACHLQGQPWMQKGLSAGLVASNSDSMILDAGCPRKHSPQLRPGQTVSVLVRSCWLRQQLSNVCQLSQVSETLNTMRRCVHEVFVRAGFTAPLAYRLLRRRNN